MLDCPEPWARFVEKGYYINNSKRVMSSSSDIEQFMSIFKVSLSKISKSALSHLSLKTQRLLELSQTASGP